MSHTSIQLRPDAHSFLEFNKGIFKISNEATLKERERTEAFFTEFYGQLLNSTATVRDVHAIQVDYCLDQVHLVNEMDVKDYDTKTKLRALFVSVMIQRVIQLKSADNEEEFFNQADAELSNLWPRFAEFNGDERKSLRDFYCVLREAKFWQIQKKWEKFAFRASSLAVNEGIWYCPGGGATIPTRNRLELFKKFEEQFIDHGANGEDGNEKKSEKKKRARSSATETSVTDGPLEAGEASNSAPRSKPRRKPKKAETVGSSTVPAIIGVDSDDDSEDYDDPYDEDWEGEWVTLADGAGYDVHAANHIAEYVSAHEAPNHPSYTRVNFENTEDGLRSYTRNKRI